jgi:hypothetical protein
VPKPQKIKGRAPRLRSDGWRRLPSAGGCWRGRWRLPHARRTRRWHGRRNASSSEKSTDARTAFPRSSNLPCSLIQTTRVPPRGSPVTRLTKTPFPNVNSRNPCCSTSSPLPARVHWVARGRQTSFCHRRFPADSRQQERVSLGGDFVPRQKQMPIAERLSAFREPAYTAGSAVENAWSVFIFRRW